MLPFLSEGKTRVKDCERHSHCPKRKELNGGKGAICAITPIEYNRFKKKGELHFASSCGEWGVQ